MSLITFSINIFFILIFILIQHLIIGQNQDQEKQGDEKLELENVKELSTVVTEDGCPFVWDLGKFHFRYMKPAICFSLRPPQILRNQNWTQETNNSPKKPFNIVLEVPTNGDDNYYPVTINVSSGFENVTITAAVMKIQRLKTDGSINLDEHGGHLECSDAQISYCCTNSKFKSLIVFIEQNNNTTLKRKELKAKWYPMNLGEAKINIAANVFDNYNSYWPISTQPYKMPMMN